MKDLRDHITCISGRRRVDTQGEVPTKCCIDPSQVCWTIMIPHKRSNLQSLDRHCRERLQDSLSVLPPCVYLMSGWYYPGTSHQHTWQNLPGLPPLYLHIYQKWPNTGGGEGLEMRLHHVAVLVTLWEVLHWGKKCIVKRIMKWLYIVHSLECRVPPGLWLEHCSVTDILSMVKQ